MSHFSHAKLRKLIAERLLEYDLIIEGGFGVNPARYSYFRSHGYAGEYVGIDSDGGVPSRVEIPAGMRLVIGNCFDQDLVRGLVKDAHAKNPLFFTYGSLSDCLLYDMGDNIQAAADTLTSLYSSQFHMRPIVSGAEVYHPRNKRSINIENEGYRRFRKFVALSAERGWGTEIVAKNLVLMQKV